MEPVQVMWTQSRKAWALQSDLSSKPGPATQHGFLLYLSSDSGPAIYDSYVMLDKYLYFSEMWFPHL